MSQKTSTAALETFRQRLLYHQRRAPGHLGGKGGNAMHMRGTQARKKYPLAQATMVTEDAMNGTMKHAQQKGSRFIFPAVLRVTSRVIAFLVWTTLAGSAFAQTGERREVRNFPVKPESVRNLRRWVDAGHDTWCRNAEFVAAATLRRIAPDTQEEYELASSALETLAYVNPSDADASAALAKAFNQAL